MKKVGHFGYEWKIKASNCEFSIENWTTKKCSWVSSILTKRWNNGCCIEQQQQQQQQTVNINELFMPNAIDVIKRKNILKIKDEENGYICREIKWCAALLIFHSAFCCFSCDTIKPSILFRARRLCCSRYIHTRTQQSQYIRDPNTQYDLTK